MSNFDGDLPIPFKLNTDSVTTSSAGKSKYAIDLDGLSSGIYRAVVSSTNIQDSVKFSVSFSTSCSKLLSELFSNCVKPPF